MNTRLIVGLGNPGQRYMATRHNAGFLLLDRLIERFQAERSTEGSNYVLWSAQTDQGPLFLMKPLTYMNLSGEALIAFLNKHPLEPPHILVTYDDIALPLGVIRARGAGSAGGQKGMRNIIDLMGTREIPRLRLGIDSPERGGRPLPDFVLEDFAEDEVPALKTALAEAEDAVVMWLETDLAKVMATFNSRAATSEQTAEPHAPVTGNGGVT